MATDKTGSAGTWAPKVGTICYLTTKDEKKPDVPPNVEVFLITETGTSKEAKRDKRGAVITQMVSVKVGEKTRDVPQAVTEDVITFGGVVLSAQKQFTEPKRNVALTSLSPLED